VDILQEIARVWREERHKVLDSASTILDRISKYGAGAAGTEVPGAGALQGAVREFEAAFDARRGGFGDAPKFPRPSELLFLLREHARTGAAEPRDMVLLTLRAMALGGMRDHLGGGFHRYSVDGDWRVPHFEKMLYDQAQLVLAFLEAAQLTGEPFYADVAADTLEYVARDLTDSAGGFYSAEDADSVPPEHASDSAPHKSEGAFYIWGGHRSRQRAGGRRRHLPDAVRRAPRWKCALRSAVGIHAQEPALHRPLDRTHRAGDRTSARRGRSSAGASTAGAARAPIDTAASAP
jgi:uncharacterized protein YyaL (SSP411 family)